MSFSFLTFLTLGIFLDFGPLSQINTCSDELLATELVFENILTPLEPEEIVALLSCLIFPDKEKNEPALTGRLLEVRSRLYTVATNLAKIQISCGE